MNATAFLHDTIPPHIARSMVLDYALGSASTICGISAAALWRLPLPVAQHSALLHRPPSTTRGSSSERDRTDDAIGRRTRLPDVHRTTQDGLFVTTPARTWLDCAQLMSDGFCVAMGDHVLRHRLGSRSDLADVVAWARGRRGVRRARYALPRLSERSESPRESWLRASLLKHGVPAPTVNIDVVHEGVWLARLDLSWPGFRVAVEYDGREFHGADRADHDRRRRLRLTEAGWIVLVVTADDIGEPHRIALAVTSALRSRGWSPTT